MSRAEEIIVKRIKEIEARQDLELEFEIWADDAGYEYDHDEQTNKWMQLSDRRFAMLELLAEIRECSIEDLVLE